MGWLGAGRWVLPYLRRRLGLERVYRGQLGSVRQRNTRRRTDGLCVDMTGAALIIKRERKWAARLCLFEVIKYQIGPQGIKARADVGFQLRLPVFGLTYPEAQHATYMNNTGVFLRGAW